MYVSLMFMCVCVCARARVCVLSLQVLPSQGVGAGAAHVPALAASTDKLINPYHQMPSLAFPYPGQPLSPIAAWPSPTQSSLG